MTTIKPGMLLGPYEIIAPIGVGGMGEVFKARDQRLDRNVAVKVLSSTGANGIESRERFKREARAISNLNHPHICTLYDVGREGDVDFLVMELLEGETLQQRLQRGALPLDQSLSFAIQIADALEKAHRQHIVHRDLKPGNIMLTKSGVKLLDFGLAKFKDPSPLDGLQTLNTKAPVTGQGTILGTVYYMAPEQLEGREADTRSDIFSFGMLIYEMVAGQRPFDGQSAMAVAGAILEREPMSLRQVQRDAPASLERILKCCLAKDPEQRWQSAADLKLELEWACDSSVQPPMEQSPTTRPRVLPIAVGALLLSILIASAVALTLYLRPMTDSLVTRFEVSVPDGTGFAAPLGSLDGDNGGAISPDGRHLVFALMEQSGQSRLWLRSLDDTVPRVLQGTEEADFPFWSPDSKTIGYFAPGKLRAIDIANGATRTICDAPKGRGGAWSSNGVIVFAGSSQGTLSTVSAGGGTPTPLTQLDAGLVERSHRLPSFLPDQEHFLYLATAMSRDQNAIWVGTVKGGPPVKAFASDTNAIFSQGHVFFVRDGHLLAQRFDMSNFKLAGDPFQIAEGVASAPNVGLGNGFGNAAFSVSPSGVLSYRLKSASDWSMAWVDRDGKSNPIEHSDGWGNPNLSRDGKRVAFELQDEIWIRDFDKGNTQKLVSRPLTGRFPLFSPSGDRIYFLSVRPPALGDIYARAALGLSEDRIVVKSELRKIPGSLSADGRMLVYTSNFPSSRLDIWLQKLDESEPKALLSTANNEQNGAISPDGRHIAYMSDESGQQEIWLQTIPPTGGRQISQNGGTTPKWRADGKELFYVTAGGEFYSVPIEYDAHGAINFREPMRLFPSRILSWFNNPVQNAYDVTGDGQRFIVSLLKNSSRDKITVVMNWPSLMPQ